jgi:hypothetical protein
MTQEAEVGLAIALFIGVIFLMTAGVRFMNWLCRIKG